MIAILLVIGLFLYLTFIGQAVVSALKPRQGLLWSWFIAPTIGLAVLVSIMTRLNVWGIPVRTFGPWLTIGLALAAAGVFAWRRPKLPLRKLAPFFLVVCGYLLYTGWPLLRFGFNWISYGNDDMANYCLAADRFLNHGYYDIPLQTQLEGSDYAQHYWYMHALQQIRPGSELTVSWISSLTGLNPHEVFMPAILMLSMLQIFALGAAAVYRGRYRKIALLACALFAMSPLFGLGTLYQLIAQVGGIALLLATASVLLTTRALNWRKLVLAGILTCCLGILYPEVSPFVALSILLFAVRLRYTATSRLKGYAAFVVGAAVLTFLLLGTSTYEFVNTLVMQSVGSAGLGAMTEINDQSGGLVLFPWTLVPSFIPMLVGLHPFGVVGIDPLISFQIVVGAVLLVYLLGRAFSNVMQDAPAGYLAAVMFPLGFFLFFKGQDFGLFKLAMFAQPVITLFLAQGFAWLMARYSPRKGAIVMGIYIVCTIPSHVYYSYASLGTYGGGLTEVVGASKLGVRFTPPKDLKYGGIESDISNVVTAKMLSQYTQGIDTRFLSRSYMDNIANIAVLKFLRTPDPDLGPQARIIEKLALLRFLLPDELMKGDVPDYRVMSIQKLDNNWTETSSRHLSYGDRLFVAVRSDLDHFNKANPGTGWRYENMYQYKLESELKDRLVFIHSELSPHYYSSARFKAAFFQREPEPITHRKVYFHGTGRYNLFQIINPSPNLRLMIDFTCTSLGYGRSKLPDHAVVIGDEDYKLPFVGHGSARVVSPILKPEYFEKQAYITIDFNQQPAPIAKEKTGLMRLYGTKYNLDDRRLVGFTRDISIITDEQYQALPRPSRIASFPGDLAKYPGLEYSGLFEDGWIGQDAYFKMGPSHPGQVLSFKGFVPDLPEFRQNGVDVTVSINDKPTEVVHLTIGEFKLTRLITEPTNITSIAMHFSGARVYDEKEDKRAVSAFVHEIAIEDQTDLSGLSQLANPKGEKATLTGMDPDGWLAKSSAITTPPFDDFKVLKLDFEMPGWAPLEQADVQVSLNGKPLQRLAIPKATYQSLYLPLVPGSANEIKLEAAADFTVTGETRQRALLVKNLSFENVSRSDLFVRGWHPSGYQFGIDRADTDGWVDRRVALTFPGTERFRKAFIEVVRFPARSDLPLDVSVNGAKQQRSLELDKTERIEVPLSDVEATQVVLSADQSYPLAAPDTRSRSFRIVNIDFQ